MEEKSKSGLFETLKVHNTPSLTNVVATYPDNPLCSALYNPWKENWYTDNAVNCVYPELAPERDMRSPAFFLFLMIISTD